MLKIVIDNKVLPVSQVQAALDELEAEGERLIKDIAQAMEVKSPTPEEKQVLATLERQQQLNSESAAKYRNALSAAQFRRLVTVTN